MLDKTTDIVRFECDRSNILYIEEVVSIYEGGQLLAQGPAHRRSWSPGDDLADAPEQVRHHAALVWTLEAIAAFQALDKPARDSRREID